jgi:hypothetical protein
VRVRPESVTVTVGTRVPGTRFEIVLVCAVNMFIAAVLATASLDDIIAGVTPASAAASAAAFICDHLREAFP